MIFPTIDGSAFFVLTSRTDLLFGEDAKSLNDSGPQAFYGNPTRRQAFMIVELNTPAEIAELMYVLSWWLKTEPTFTPIMPLITMPRQWSTRRRSSRHNLERWQLNAGNYWLVLGDLPA